MKVKDERRELEKLLDTSAPRIDAAVPSNINDQIPGLQAEPVTDVNFVELRKKCEGEAKLMLKKSIKFIVPADMLKSDKYLKDKLKLDILTLGGMIYQLRCNEVMQKALIDQINLGLVNAKMFEVFTQMSKTVGDLNKQLIQTIEAIKLTYMTYKDEIREKQTETFGAAPQTGLLTSGNGMVITRGTKELINRTKEIKYIESDE